MDKITNDHKLFDDRLISDIFLLILEKYREKKEKRA